MSGRVGNGVLAMRHLRPLLIGFAAGLLVVIALSRPFIMGGLLASTAGRYETAVKLYTAHIDLFGPSGENYEHALVFRAFACAV
jgi:hypothetical protein